jgi:hypothetical protein
MEFAPICRKTDIVVQEIESEFLIYDLKINKAYCLNETSAMVYQLCDGKRTVAEISDLMSSRLNALVSEDFVYLALRELERENLLEDNQQFEDKFAGMNRREIVKKVGLTSMIALPLISSVIAPPAASAQSGPICPMSGECYPAGTPICGGDACVGMYPVTTYTAGSNCTALIGGATLNCVVAVGMFGVDIKIT